MTLSDPLGGSGAYFTFTTGEMNEEKLFEGAEEFYNNIGVSVGAGDGTTNSGTITFPAGSKGLYRISYILGGSTASPTGGIVLPDSAKLQNSINLDVSTASIWNTPYPDQANYTLGGTTPTMQRGGFDHFVIMGDERLPCIYVIDTGSYAFPGVAGGYLMIDQLPNGFLDGGDTKLPTEALAELSKRISIQEIQDEKSDGDWDMTPARASSSSSSSSTTAPGAVVMSAKFPFKPVKRMGLSQLNKKYLKK